MTSSLLQLQLTGRSVVLFGGGESAHRRAIRLAAQGARVQVVAPDLIQPLRRFVDDGHAIWAGHEPDPEQLRGAWLVSLRTSDAAVADMVQDWCEERQIWCEGGDSALALDELLTAEPVDAGQVVLVGGGPGDPGLLTLRAIHELAAADVIVTDRLGPTDAVTRLNPQARVIDVGKQPYHHPVPQGEINAILIAEARAGGRVVRLKGGDPFVFGRGGEELLACRAAGVAVEVVPGISSSLAAPLAAGIPVTHRGTSTGVLILSGHDDLTAEVVGRWPGTIVVLMGMARLGELTASLLSHGKDPVTPAAVVASAWTPQQRSVHTDLATLHARVTEAGLTNPAVIIIGDVVDVLGGNR